MNYRIIINTIGFLLIITGIFVMTAIPVSIYYAGNDLTPLLVSGLITLFAGLITWFFSRTENKDLGRREGYIIVTAGWLIISVFGSLPYLIHGSIPDFSDAFFETISGFTTTGATILKDIEEIPPGLIFWRSLTQWLGGMGIIVLSIAILPLLGIGGLQLYLAEVPGPTKDKIHPRVRETAKRLWGIYLILTLAEVIFLFIGGMNFFDAVNHALTTMATGGFSPKNNSTAHYSSPFIQYVLIVFMFLAGTNFTLHYFALHGKFGAFKSNNEFRFYAALTIIFTIFIAAAHFTSRSAGIEESLRDSLFHVVSLMTTTGFVSSDYEKWASFSQIIFFLLLFVGGCAGSTGGGIKIIRHFLLYKNSLLELKRLVHPRAVIPVRINGKAVSSEIILNVQAFFLFYIMIFFLGALLISFSGLNFVTALGASATCIGNIGPGLGLVGPVSNFSEVSVFAKWILSILMLIGRLEIFTVLLIFSPAFWQK